MVNPLQGTGNTGSTQQMERTHGTGAPQSGSGGPTMSTNPIEVEQQTQQWGVPQLDPPRLDPKALNERYTSIRKSLDTGEVQDMSVIMQQIEELQIALDQEQMRNQKNEIDANKKSIDDNVNAQIKKFGEAEEKLKSQQTWGLFMKIFSVAAAILSVVATVATAIATGGVTLPLALAATASVIGATVAILQATGGDKAIFDALKVPDTARMWISLGISAALFVMNLPSIVQAVKAAVQLGSTLASTVAKGIESTATTVSNAQKVAMVASFARSATELSQGGTKIGESVTGFQVAQVEDDRKRLQTRNMQLQQLMDDLMDGLKELMEKMEESVRGTAEVVQTQATTTQFLVRSGA